MIDFSVYGCLGNQEKMAQPANLQIYHSPRDSKIIFCIENYNEW